MEKFKVAAVQMNALRGKLDHNIEVHQKLARECAADDCRLIMFPELSVTCHYGDDEVTSLAQEAERGSIYDAMRSLAKETGSVIGYGFCEKAHGTYYNAYGLMTGDGLVGVQRKVHASQDEYFSFRMGRSWELFDLGFCKVGVSICLDSFFFETWRVLALMGADLLLLPHASRLGWGEEIDKEKQLKEMKERHEKLPGNNGVYAGDNLVYAAFCNQVDYNGHSTHHGDAYVLGPRGDLLACNNISLDNLWVSAELDPKVLDEARNGRFSTMRTRRPEMYSEIAKMI